MLIKMNLLSKTCFIISFKKQNFQNNHMRVLFQDELRQTEKHTNTPEKKVLMQFSFFRNGDGLGT